jgi:hypothetical protein
LEGGPPCFPQTHRGSWYSGCSQRRPSLPVRDSHPLWCCLPTASSLPGSVSCCSYNPSLSCLRNTGWFGLFPSRSPLLRESRLISSRRATEMFQFAHCPPACLYIQQAVSRHHSGRVAPFGFSGLSARMQLPLNVSPVSASFFGLQRLGIHPVLSLTCAPSCSLRLLSRGLTGAHTRGRFPLRLSFSLFLPWQY